MRPLIPSVQHVLFLHLPKTGGTSVGTWLRANAKLIPTLGPVTTPGGNWFNCQCAPLHRMATGGSFFNASAIDEGGSIVEGHWDASIATALERLRPSEWATTAVIVSTRSPLQRATSLYHYYRAAGSRQYASDSLRAYLARSELDNPLARSLAGAGVNGAQCGCADMCAASGSDAGGERAQICSSTLSATLSAGGGTAFLPAAEEFLERHACAVFVSERALESAEYLAYILGASRTRLQPLRNENTFLSMATKRDTETAVPRTQSGWDVPQAVSGSFERRNAADYALHNLSNRRLDAQLEAMRSASAREM